MILKSWKLNHCKLYLLTKVLYIIPFHLFILLFFLEQQGQCSNEHLPSTHLSWVLSWELDFICGLTLLVLSGFNKHQQLTKRICYLTQRSWLLFSPSWENKINGSFFQTFWLDDNMKSSKHDYRFCFWLVAFGWFLLKMACNLTPDLVPRAFLLSAEKALGTRLTRNSQFTLLKPAASLKFYWNLWVLQPALT